MDDNVIDFETFKKCRKIVKQNIEAEKPQDLRLITSPEQLRKFAFSMEQQHLGKVKAAQETQEILPDYEVSISLLTSDSKSIKLTWYPLR